MNKYALAAATMLLGWGTSARADVLNMEPGRASLETVIVGDPGNAPDNRYGGYGAVDYTYKIGKYEVTAGQYTQFLNAIAKTDAHGVYNADMWYEPYNCRIERSGTPGNYRYEVAREFAHRPVNFVGYWDACRFCNWLNNGQPTGLQDASTTEDGAYTLNGYDGNDARLIRRNPGAKWFLPTEDEWYKAAYYKGGGTNAGYWDYPTKSDTITTGMANYAWAAKHNTDVGSYAADPGPYGTFDQGGNVDEWVQVAANGNGLRQTLRGGGDWYGHDAYYLRASTRLSANIYPTYIQQDIGFRIAGSVGAP